MLTIVLEKFKTHRERITQWLLSEKEKAGVHPFYASTDLRNSGFKVSIVDTNLFPAGFNNMCKGFLRGGSKQITEYFSKHFPKAKKIGILTEDHTRNTYYLENVQALADTVRNAGFEVLIMDSLEAFITNEKNVDCIIVNNDYSGGLPEPIKNSSTPLLPPPQAGWHIRRKSEHFVYLKHFTNELAKLLEIDPWLLFPETTVVQDISISDAAAREKLAQSATELLAAIQKKYTEFGITEKPYLFMKDDAGTYGMGVTTVTDPAEILAFNKKRRDTFKFGKNKKPITSILLQEGLPTSERIKGMASEPVVYVMNHTAIGGFFRMHQDADDRSSLNRPGMQFTKLCFHEITEYHNTSLPDSSVTDLEALYFTLGSVASFAASREITELLKKS